MSSTAAARPLARSLVSCPDGRASCVVLVFHLVSACRLLCAAALRGEVRGLDEGTRLDLIPRLMACGLVRAFSRLSWHPPCVVRGYKGGCWGRPTLSAALLCRTEVGGKSLTT